MFTNTLQGWLCLFLRSQWFYYWNSIRLILLRPRLFWHCWKVGESCWLLQHSRYRESFACMLIHLFDGSKVYLDFKIALIADCFKTMLSFTPDWFTDFVILFSDHHDSPLRCVHSDEMELFWSTVTVVWSWYELNKSSNLLLFVSITNWMNIMLFRRIVQGLRRLQKTGVGKTL